MALTDPRLDPASIPLLIWTAGPDGACDNLNQRWSDFTGRPVAELLGWRWSDWLHPDDRERVVAEYSAAVAGREAVRVEFRLRHQDGEYRWFLGTGEPRYRPDGAYLGYSGCAIDVSDRRQPEQRLAQSGRVDDIAQLAGGIGHDFNNLVTGILGHVTLLLEEGSLSEKAREDLAQIRFAADRAAVLTRQLLAFSRRPQLAPRFLDLNQLVTGIMSAIRQVAGTAVEVSFALEEGLEPVLADPGQLEHILLQLGTHGRVSMPGGGGLRLRTGRAQVDETHAATRPGLRPGSYVTLEVGYTGAGLDSEALARLFVSPPAGTGGQAADLSSVSGIARQSGGHMAVESDPAGGTTLILYIPRLKSALESTEESELAVHDGSETILLVEEDAQVRDVVCRALERAGYTALVAGDAEMAIAAADRHPGHIHLLAADVILPRVSGRELAARLAIHRPAIKVLYLSGTSDGVIARHRMLEPGIEFLEKPFTLDRFLRKVRQVLGADTPANEANSWAQRSLV